jgi:hypothetical protein
MITRVNLQKEMQSGKIMDLKTDLAIQQFNEIVENCSKEDVQILERLNLNKNIKIANEFSAEKEFLSHFDQTRIFSLKEIERVCGVYGLRCLATKYYSGTIDPLLPSKIKEFEEIRDSAMFNIKAIGGADVDLKYKIMAPKESFKLEKTPKDPLLFAHIYDEHWYLVHKWGHDLSIFRKITMPIKRTPQTFFVLLFIIPLIFLAFDQDHYYKNNIAYPYQFLTITNVFLLLLFVILPTCFFMGRILLRDEAFSEFED